MMQREQAVECFPGYHITQQGRKFCGSVFEE